MRGGAGRHSTSSRARRPRTRRRRARSRGADVARPWPPRREPAPRALAARGALQAARARRRPRAPRAARLPTRGGPRRREGRSSRRRCRGRGGTRSWRRRARAARIPDEGVSRTVLIAFPVTVRPSRPTRTRPHCVAAAITAVRSRRTRHRSRSTAPSAATGPMIRREGPGRELLCVPLKDTAWMRVSDVHDIPAELRNEIEHFFQVYKDLEEAKVETRGYGNRPRRWRSSRPSRLPPS